MRGARYPWRSPDTAGRSAGTGGYPEPWISGDEEFRRLWHRNYLDTYLLRNVGALFPGLNRDRFRLLIQILGNVSGSILNNAEIARTLGVPEPTVRASLATHPS